MAGNAGSNLHHANGDLARAEFAHILGAFPLVFPADAQGTAKRAALLAVYDKTATDVV